MFLFHAEPLSYIFSSHNGARFFQILRNGPLRFDLILFWIQHASIRSNPLDSDSTRSVHIQIAPKLLLRNGASICSDPLRSASKPASTSNILLARPDFKTFRFASRTDWLITVSPIFLRENRIVHTDEFYTLCTLPLSLRATRCTAKSVEKLWERCLSLRVLLTTRKRRWRALRSFATRSSTYTSDSPRLHVCRHVSAIVISYCIPRWARACTFGCVWRFRYGPRGMNERKRRVETVIVVLRLANWRGKATLRQCLPRTRLNEALLLGWGIKSINVFEKLRSSWKRNCKAIWMQIFVYLWFYLF